ncbi:MAG TPA: hypothetical protein VFS21_40345 [Roseiflexaceae bacterium]|nr:hypothetical protein [Roseiflexaceae bacterium]
MQQHTATLVPATEQEIGFEPATGTWTAYYDGVAIQQGSTSPVEARAARDAYIVNHRRHHQALPTSELLTAQEEVEPVGVPVDSLAIHAPVGPYPDWKIAPDTLNIAYALFLKKYGSQPKIMERAARALGLARSTDHWIIPEEGVVWVRGSRAQEWYIVGKPSPEDTTCDCTKQRQTAEGEVLSQQPCKDQTHWHHHNLGLCKHAICRELLRLAQHLSRGAIPTPDATVTLPARLFGLALSIASLGDGNAITIEIRDSTLQIGGQQSHQVQLACEAGEGHGAIAVSHAVLCQLWDELRPRAIVLREEPLLCHLDTARSELRVAGPGLDLAIPGRAL